MGYRCIDAEGNALFGDRVIDEGFVAMCDAADGRIYDDVAKKIVHPPSAVEEEPAPEPIVEES